LQFLSISWGRSKQAEYKRVFILFKYIGVGFYPFQKDDHSTFGLALMLLTFPWGLTSLALFALANAWPSTCQGAKIDHSSKYSGYAGSLSAEPGAGRIGSGTRARPS
jgi:hypothetical protein